MLSEHYKKKRTFIDFFANDLTDGKVWFNISEFGRYHDINGYKLLSILATNTDSKALTTSEQNPQGINEAEGVLFCRAQEIKGVKEGQVIRVDYKEYVISKANLLQGQVWRIELTRIQE